MAKIGSGFKKRVYAALALLLAGFFVADICNLFYLQVIKSDELKSKAESQQLSDTLISAGRGTIYDSDMNILAESATAWLVYINPSKVEDADMAAIIVNGLSEALGVTQEKVQKAVDQNNYSYVKIKGELTYAEKEAVSTLIDDNKLYGIVSIDPDTKRYYPYSNFASTVIGFTGADDDGRDGLELTYDTTLTGTPGRVITAKNAQSGAMPNNYETTYDAQKGESPVLTINSVIQYTLEKGLEQAVADNSATGAYGIVMDVNTGAVLAMSTKPDYDLNDPYTIYDANTLADINAITEPEAKSTAYSNALFSQWRNNAISDTYEPGSVFKLFTLSAALETGTITPSFTYTCTGSINVAGNRISCHYHNGHGTQTVEKGLMNSCNPFFITVGQKLGSENFYKYFEAFGFTEKTGIDLPGEASPAANVTYYTGDRLGISELSSCAFGQTFQISAIQMITGVCAIANGGKLMTPFLVKNLIDGDGNIVYTNNGVMRRQVISETTSQTVIGMMENVVKSGTGKNAYIPGYRVCGKTGTSEKLTKDNEYIASFVGFAPADDPKIAVLIVIDEPHGAQHGGGAIAAPVAGEVLEQALKYLNVEPVYSDAELAKLSATSPQVTGSSVTSAKGILANQGFTARVVGSGTTVVSQSPLGGQTMPKNGVVVLYTDDDTHSKSATVPVLTGLSISEANKRAINSGFNIKISGSSLDGEVLSYRQSIEAGVQAELGSVITVYFKTDTGVSDF